MQLPSGHAAILFGHDLILPESRSTAMTQSYPPWYTNRA